MSKSAFAPHSGWSVTRQRADVPPPHSSVKMTLVPSLLNVAECQYEKFGSATASSRTGFTGSEMSSRMPLPWHAPAARPISGYAVMSWHVFVFGIGEYGVPDGCSGCRGSVFCRPLNAPVAGSVKIRGWLTIAAVSGAASGTLMTSIRHCVGLPVVTGAAVAGAFSQPASSAAGRTPAGARVVDVDVVGVVGVGDERVRVRTAARLHARQLHRVARCR